MIHVSRSDAKRYTDWLSRRTGEECRRPAERGGAFSFYPWTIRASARSYYWPSPNWHEREDDAQGFRVARAVNGSS